MVIALVLLLVLSLVIVALDVAGVSHALRAYEESLLRSIDFSDVLMQACCRCCCLPARCTWT